MCRKTYYAIDIDYHALRAGSEYDILNEKTLQSDGSGLTWSIAMNSPVNPGPWRFPDYVETPRIIVKQRNGRKIRDFAVLKHKGPWIVSAAMKAVLDAIDPTAFEYRRCETVLPSGESGPETWLCVVTRAFWRAVDTEDTAEIQRVPWSRPENPLYERNAFPHKGLTFRPEIVGDAHVFHLADVRVDIICDQAFKNACKLADIKGITFEQISNLKK